MTYFFLKQVKTTTIIFFIYKTFYFKLIIIHMKRIFDLKITPISNTHVFIYFVHCIIAHLLQGSVMEQPLYRHRPRLSMTQSVIEKYIFTTDLDSRRLKDITLEYLILLLFVVVGYRKNRHNGRKSH